MDGFHNGFSPPPAVPRGSLLCKILFLQLCMLRRTTVSFCGTPGLESLVWFLTLKRKFSIPPIWTLLGKVVLPPYLEEQPGTINADLDFHRQFVECKWSLQAGQSRKLLQLVGTLGTSKQSGASLRRKDNFLPPRYLPCSVRKLSRSVKWQVVRRVPSLIVPFPKRRCDFTIVVFHLTCLYDNIYCLVQIFIFKPVKLELPLGK